LHFLQNKVDLTLRTVVGVDLISYLFYLEIKVLFEISFGGENPVFESFQSFHHL